MDYLPYRWTNHAEFFYTTVISVDFAKYDIFARKFVISDKDGINFECCHSCFD